jgi:thiamine-phosphate pyrophosphorylase
VLRLIDANVDRLGEGLRVLEDVARFLLDDAVLSRRLKTLRHKLNRDIRPLEQQLLASRRVTEDVGAFARPPGGVKHEDLPALVKANSSRVQESLRVLEEFARLADSPLRTKSAEFERCRFEVYDLEQELVSRLVRREKAGLLAGLYLMLDGGRLGDGDVVGVATDAIRGGARVVQWRGRHRSRAELLRIARKLKKVCEEGKALFIVSGHLDLALAAGADGIHLGQDDLPLPEARRLLPMDKLIGCSVTSLFQARQAKSQGADYVVVGPIYPTLSGRKSRLVRVDKLRRIKAAVSLPVIASGGIDLNNIEDVLEAGADGVAVVGTGLGAEDIEEATRGLADRLEQFSLRGA